MQKGAVGQEFGIIGQNIGILYDNIWIIADIWHALYLKSGHQLRRQ